MSSHQKTPTPSATIDDEGTPQPPLPSSASTQEQSLSPPPLSPPKPEDATKPAEQESFSQTKRSKQPHVPQAGTIAPPPPNAHALQPPAPPDSSSPPSLPSADQSETPADNQDQKRTKNPTRAKRGWANNLPSGPRADDTNDEESDRATPETQQKKCRRNPRQSPPSPRRRSRRRSPPSPRSRSKRSQSPQRDIAPGTNSKRTVTIPTRYSDFVTDPPRLLRPYRPDTDNRNVSPRKKRESDEASS